MAYFKGGLIRRQNMSSTFGTIFKVTTFGESHGKGVGAVVDGCPPGMALDESDIQPQLDYWIKTLEL